MKRVMRKRLKQDEFVSTLTKLVDLAKKWSKQLIMGATVVVIVILAVLISNAIKAQAVKRDSRILGDILEISTQLNDSPEKVAELEALAGNGKFSRVAYLKLAAFAIEQGDSGKAKSYLEKVKDNRKDITYYQAQDMLAQVYIGDKEYDKAIAIYKTIEEDGQKDYTLDAILFHMAEAHEGKGEREIALEIYKRVQQEYSQSFYGFDASKKVAELEEKK
ncbi:MAG: tetratricopeptide repeat protein [Candidatus Aminicenantes bacterium]|nr:MAG: tetratricopeptide repeat protein [Candidatus Aminicenantes bacterium]